MQEGCEAHLPDKLEVVLIWIQPVSKQLWEFCSDVFDKMGL